MEKQGNNTNTNTNANANIISIPNSNYFTANESKATATEKSSKSTRSVKSQKKKLEIAAATIITSIERDIADLLMEITLRAHRNKLIGITENLKSLNKKFSTLERQGSFEFKENITHTNISNQFQRYNTSVIDFNSYKCTTQATPPPELEEQNKAHENEIKKLKEEITTLQSKISNFSSIPADYESKLTKKDDALNKLNSKFEQANILLGEEKSKTNSYVGRMKTLEEALKSLNDEYNSLSHKFGKLQNECDALEKCNTDLKKSTSDSKLKLDELRKINGDLKGKIIEYENTIQLLTEDIKSLLKKNSTMQKAIDDLEAKNKILTFEIDHKDERLHVLRAMNNKLQQKSNLILKKWEAFHLLEEKYYEMMSQNKQMYAAIQEMNNKMSSSQGENEMLKKEKEDLLSEKEKLKADCEEYKLHISKIKAMNEDLIGKNTELENKFKISLQRADQRENSIIVNKGKGYFSPAISNNYSKVGIGTNTAESFILAKLSDNQIEEAKPGKNTNVLDIK